MANDDIDWPVEHIPDEADVYLRAHRKHLRDRTLLPGVFQEHDGGMSVDWEKYSTPEETRQRARKPMDNAVVSLPVGGIRDIKIRDTQILEVTHEPDTESPNQAHSEVFGLPEGEDLTEVRMLLLDISTVVLHLTDA